MVTKREWVATTADRFSWNTMVITTVPPAAMLSIVHVPATSAVHVLLPPSLAKVLVTTAPADSNVLPVVPKDNGTLVAATPPGLLMVMANVID